MTTGSPAADMYDEFVPFHDLCYPDRGAEIDFYTSLLRHDHRSVLELGCGTGTIVSAVAKVVSARHGRASHAVGVDRSPAMLAWARRQHPTLKWIQGDMVQPPVRGQFDFVVCAFNTLQMLHSHSAVLRTFDEVRELLGADGLFVFDLYNASCSETGDSSNEGRLDRVVRSFSDESGRCFEVREDAVEDPRGESVQLDWRIMDVSENGALQRARLVMRLRHYSPGTIERLVKTAGLRILHRYGDVRKSPFDMYRSKKQVVLCSR
jgi:SAM-dependent methyltransferase